MSSQLHKHYRLLLTIPQKWPRFGFLVYDSQGFRGKIPIQNHENRHQHFKGTLPKSSDLTWRKVRGVFFALKSCHRMMCYSLLGDTWSLERFNFKVDNSLKRDLTMIPSAGSLRSNCSTLHNWLLEHHGNLFIFSILLTECSGRHFPSRDTFRSFD